MNKRLTLFLLIGLIVVLSLGLAACEKERPAPTPSRTTPAPVRGTVTPTAPAPAALTEVAPAALSGAAAGQVTPAQAGTATPTAPAPQPVAVTPEGAGGATSGGQVTTYTVAAGDTLGSIAAKFGTTADAIAQLNHMADPNALVVGQQLQIPGAQSAGTTTTTTSSTTTYVVQAGDTLASIAKRFGTTVNQLAQLNNLTDPNIIILGQKLIVPSGTGATSTPAASTTPGHGQTYTVQSGDTLMKIARKFGVTVQQLQTANKITNPDRIYPGQVLVIP